MKDFATRITWKKEKGRNVRGKFYNLLANFLTVGKLSLNTNCIFTTKFCEYRKFVTKIKSVRSEDKYEQKSKIEITKE